MAKSVENAELEAALGACNDTDAVDTRDFLARLSDKWSVLIVVVLSHMPQDTARFSELKRAIDGISQTMLTATLRALERDGIVTRRVFPEVPPRVEYKLTELGRDLLEPVKSLFDWASQNWHRVKAARAEHDRRASS